jgi:phosphoenolpyruvate carboxylase
VQSAVRYDVSYVEFLRARETLSRLRPPSGLGIKETWVEVASHMYLAKIAEVAPAVTPPEKEYVGNNMERP